MTSRRIAARLITIGAALLAGAGACGGRNRIDLFQESPTDDAGAGGRGEWDGGDPWIHCDTRDDCPAELPRCDRDDDRCVECLEKADCGPDESCRLQDHRCVPSCRDDGDCAGGGGICAVSSGLCVDCGTDDDCTSDWRKRCATRAGRCVECLDHADCPDGRCRTEDADFECVECLTDDDCEGSAECVRGECQR